MSTKPCIVCAEQIQAAATRCPHCHQVQSKFLQFFNTGKGGLVILGGVAAFGVYMLLKEPVRWKAEASSIKISEIQVKASRRSNSVDMSCTALLKNEGGHSWKEPVVEASFFDSDGKLIDTATQRLGSVVLRAGGEARVRVLEQAAWEPADYAKCSISLRHAVLD